MFEYDPKMQSRLQDAYMLQEKIYKRKKMLLCKIRNSKPLNERDLKYIEKYCITF